MTDVLLGQTKCNLEILPDGIMLFGDFTANSRMIPVMKNKIESIALVRGKEVIDTFYLYPNARSFQIGHTQPHFALCEHTTLGIYDKRDADNNKM